MKFRVLLLSLAFSGSVVAQVNLVPNGGFDTITSCPTNGQVSLASPWFRIGTAALMNECGSNGYTVPGSSTGFQFPLSGSGYTRLTLWAENVFGFNGSGLVVELVDELMEQELYSISFYVSMQDSIWYATNIFNLYLSQVEPTIESIIQAEPYFRYLGDFVTDKENWIQIEGSFIANGGERFLTIGNFDGPALTDTLFVGGGIPPINLPDYYKVSAYYIDDVSLYQVYTTVGLIENEESEFEIFPNPVPENFNVKRSGQGPANLQLTDATGRVVLSVPMQGQWQVIDASGLPQGVYVVQVLQNGITLGRQKLFKQ